MFIDYAVIEITAGKGGDGAVAFRREKFVPKGGPAGGNGGKGGNIVVEAHHNLNTLLDFRYKRKYKAQNGEMGGNSLKDGKSGNDVVIKVPLGTVIKDFKSKKSLFDLNKNNKKIILTKGGKGGKGNSNFATATNQTPRYAESGKPGEYKKVILELKLIADVGLVGFPNAGKSTLISTISEARPKIADYPFTTLTPNLGIVKYKEYSNFTVADIPGIIEDAHKGKGLGHQFLRHIERTKVILLILEITSENHHKDFEILYKELKSYSPRLTEKKIIVALSKADLINEEKIKELAGLQFGIEEISPVIFSSVSNYGLDELRDIMWQSIQEASK
ncbi:MAG: GTPase ObgE [Ignavibacteria bacterium]|nr:GTPase ObgE [Ignavibacteria bacterium]